MIFSVYGETTCPECDVPVQFEVEDTSGEIDVKCDACGHVEKVKFEVTVEVL